jgi:succinate dehydrogenase / fumarate reductase cytochrome b subunit
MSAVAADSHLARSVRFYQTTIGKKVVMAATGIILFGYLLAHMLGNLQIFAGPAAINGYAVMLRKFPMLLWTARTVLLVSVVLHIIASVQLTMLKKAARPVGYYRKENIASSYASRTMMWTGPIIAVFVVYHIMHFTTGNVHPDFYHLDPYGNAIRGFEVKPVAIAYVVVLLLLGMHLYHGLWSMFQTLGASHPRYTPWFKRFAVIFTLLIVIGFITVPIAVMAGILNLENGTQL